jgi:signal transduction histidine kinase
VTVEMVNEAGAAPPGITGGRGLSGLTTRVTALGGALSAGPSPRGWVLCAEVPIRQGPS